MILTYDSYSDIGDRPYNEDAVFVAQKPDGQYLLAVADGLGGHGGGDIASRIVVDNISHSFNNGRLDIDVALSAANDEIIQLQQEKSIKCRSTIALVWFSSEGVAAATVGDTRIYAFTNGDIVFQSIDHSGAQLAVAVGEITPSQIRGHEDRNILTRAVGASENLKVDIRALEAQFDALLICSDGFWERVDEQQMSDTLLQSSSPEEWLEKMRYYADKAVLPEKDNNSAIAVFVR